MSAQKKHNIIRTMFRTLRYRNFRLFITGQSVSLVGTWMQQIAMSWLVYRMTGSVLLLGVVSFSSQLPLFLLSPFAGVIADRTDRRRTLIITQALAMAQAFILAVLTITGTVAVWHVIVLGVFLGCINSLDVPCRQSFVVEMVERKENLANAIALNSLSFNAARLIGPSIAGLIIALAGEGVCFLINGITFLAVIISLFAIKTPTRRANQAETHILAGLKEGFIYTFGFMPIKLILFLVSVLSIMGVSYVVLLPVFARDIIGGGASTLGFLMASAGVGALVATLYLASRKSIVGLNRIIPITSSIFAIGLIMFSLSNIFWISLLLLATSGFGFMVSMAANNIILQTIVDDDKRGRVMSLYSMAFLGTAPFGGLIAGYLASRVGVSNTLVIGGAFCLIASIIFAGRMPLMSKAIHPIYKRIGIIPEVASGINNVVGIAVPPED